MDIYDSTELHPRETEKYVMYPINILHVQSTTMNSI